MKTEIKLNQLWGCSGTISRKPFVIWAALLFGIAEGERITHEQGER